MQQENTRQRQGRDFIKHNHLATAEMSVEGNYNNIDGIIGNSIPKDDTAKKQTLLEKLEHHRKEAERKSKPVDGYEPPERG